MHVPPSCEATPRWHQAYECLAMAGGRGRGARGGRPPCPPRHVAGACSCPAPHPCAAPPRIGIWLARTICSLRPVAMVTGWLETGFHQRPGTLGKKSRQGKVFLFFLGGNEGEREGPCRRRLRSFLPPRAPAWLSCPQAPLARPPFPSRLSLSLQFESPVHVCSSSEMGCGCAGVCWEMSCLPRHGGRP